MLERLIEEKIRAAMARGEFDDLAGRGQPIDLTYYFQLPEESRVAFTLLRDHHIVPEEVSLLQDLAALRQQLAECRDETQRAQLKHRHNEKQMLLSMMLEKRRTQAR